jgi:hypothetical protein
LAIELESFFISPNTREPALVEAKREKARSKPAPSPAKMVVLRALSAEKEKERRENKK